MHENDGRGHPRGPSKPAGHQAVGIDDRGVGGKSGEHLQRHEKQRQPHRHPAQACSGPPQGKARSQPSAPGDRPLGVEQRPQSPQVQHGNRRHPREQCPQRQQAAANADPPENTANPSPGETKPPHDGLGDQSRRCPKAADGRPGRGRFAHGRKIDVEGCVRHKMLASADPPHRDQAYQRTATKPPNREEKGCNTR